MTHAINGYPFNVPDLASDFRFPDPPDLPETGAEMVEFDRILDGILNQAPGAAILSRSLGQPAVPPAVAAAAAQPEWQALYNRIVNQGLAEPVYMPYLEDRVAAFTPVHARKQVQSAAGDGKNVITDEEFYNADSLTPEQIDQILAERGSPYAGRRYDGGKTAGQLIWEKAHNAGTVPQGPHTINPALLLGIMGAETEFGKTGWGATNPFNIRINGGFDSVKAFEESLSIAANSMYNAAIARPAGSTTSLFDYAGNIYCENYEQTWKPNVEALFREFVGEIDDKLVETAQNGGPGR